MVKVCCENIQLPDYIYIFNALLSSKLKKDE